MDHHFVQTTCPYCGCGCQMLLQVMNGRLIGTNPLKTAPMNQGKLCIKGWNAHEFVHSPERLTTPLIRKNGKLEEASWEEALDFTVSQLKDIRDKHGGDSVGFFASARCTNEDNYVLQKFCRAGFGTNNVDHCTRLRHAPTVAGLAAAFGSGAMTNSIPEIADVNCLLVVGSNTTEAHPLISHWMFRAKRNGAKLIVVDPRRIQLSLQADTHIRLNFGTDVAFINGMMHAILANNWHNLSSIDERTEGFAELREHLQGCTPEMASEICGVPPEDIVRVAEMYATADRSSICYTLGITEHSHGVDNVKSLANLAMLTGQIGRPSTGVNPMRGQNNVQGTCDMGALPNVYPGYQVVTDDTIREKFERAWQAKLSSKVGYTIPDMMDKLIDGSLKCLYILGENSALSDPNTHHVVHALNSAEFLIVQDIFLTETAQLAHVVLPGACWAEKEGTFSNTERKVQRVRKAVDNPPGTIPDWKIVAELGKRLGLSMDYGCASDIFDEMAGLTFSNSDKVALVRHQPGMTSSTYLFFPGCQLSGSSPEHVKNTYDYLTGRLQGGVGLMLGCCGAPADWAGRAETFSQVLGAFQSQWLAMGSPQLILACSSCHAIFKAHLPEAKLLSLWEVFDKWGLPGTSFGAGPTVLAIHDPCTSRHEPQMQESVRKIIRAMGLEVFELPLSRGKTECCGFGGVMYFASRELAQKVVERRINETPMNLLGYCAVCCDHFRSGGKPTWHLLDLIFGDGPIRDAPLFAPDYSQRRENRVRLKNKLLSSLWNDKGVEMEDDQRIVLQIPEKVRELMAQRMILSEDVQQVIQWAEGTGTKLVNGETRHSLAHYRPGSVTYWVEYSGADKAFTVHNAYSHRMELLEELT